MREMQKEAVNSCTYKSYLDPALNHLRHLHVSCHVEEETREQDVAEADAPVMPSCMLLRSLGPRLLSKSDDVLAEHLPVNCVFP